MKWFCFSLLWYPGWHLWKGKSFDFRLIFLQEACKLTPVKCIQETTFCNMFRIDFRSSHGFGIIWRLANCAITDLSFFSVFEHVSMATNWISKRDLMKKLNNRWVMSNQRVTCKYKINMISKYSSTSVQINNFQMEFIQYAHCFNPSSIHLFGWMAYKINKGCWL